MSIQTEVKSDLNIARKTGAKHLVQDLKIIMGEFARIKGTKIGNTYVKETITNEQAVKILNGIIKAEEKTKELTGIDSSSLKEIAKAYLPEMVSEEEIRDFIGTIDFTTLKNKMQAIGIVKKKYGSSVDGKLVSNIVQSL